MCGIPPSFTPFANTLLGVIIGLCIKEVWEWYRRPTLKIAFDPDDDGCRAYTPLGSDQSGEGYYIRTKVVNSKRRLAKSCRAFLVNVEEKTAEGDFKPIVPRYADSLPLTWSSQPGEIGNGPIDLPAGTTHWVNLISTDKGVPGYAVHTLLSLYRFSVLTENKPKVLRLTILVTGDDARKDEVKIIFDWRGQWDTFEVAQG